MTTTTDPVNVPPAVTRWRELVAEAAQLKPELPDPFGFARAALANSRLLSQRAEFVAAREAVRALPGADAGLLKQSLGFFAMSDSANATAMLELALTRLSEKPATSTTPINGTQRHFNRRPA